MRAIKLKAVVDKNARLSVSLPPDVPTGTVEVIILLDQDDTRPTGNGDDAFAELMSFHKDHRLDGISLKELVTEGRR